MEREILGFVLVHVLVVALAILAAGGLGAAFRSVCVALASGGAILACLNALFLGIELFEGKVPHPLCYGLPVLLIVLGIVMLHAAQLHQSREKVSEERDELKEFRYWFGREDFVDQRLQELAVVAYRCMQSLEEFVEERAGSDSPRPDKRAEAIIDDVKSYGDSLDIATRAFKTARKVAYANGFNPDADWLAHLPSDLKAESKKKSGGQASTSVSTGPVEGSAF